MTIPYVYSFVLSQILGLCMVIIAIVMLNNSQHYRRVFSALKPTDPAVLVASVFSLFIGIILVVTHNAWEFKPRIVLTLVCWFIFIKALLWLAMPVRMVGFTKKICTSSAYYWIITSMLTLGVLMLVRGFWAIVTGESYYAIADLINWVLHL